ncbi:hypothetical protein K402DRAFT_398222 [Aulographum hederae CBS 113979]|uniref:Heterokaryon incompatibility domain-containing protein n=1 Tax=Aulographum hederae CBS 113979 TaxID=1176131 RepID=A0A6G1GLI7_9PEZI|nr:hypothetical protein K402DRAFT_398222 [Aulographum hederae CBS 113979]
MAKHAILHCGNHSIEWPALMRLSSWIRNRGSVIQARFNPKFGLHLMLWLAYDTSRDDMDVLTTNDDKPINFNFLDILRFSGELYATDSRDHLYAFLNHPTSLKNVDGALMIPSYTDPVGNVYYDFAFHHIRTTKKADILSYVAHRPEFQATLTDDYPTWIPQWDTFEGMSGIGIGPASSNAWYNASKKDQFKPEFLNDGRLKVYGVQVGLTEFASAAMTWDNLCVVREIPRDNPPQHPLGAIWHYLFNSHRQPNADYEDEYLALALTLLADNYLDTQARTRLDEVFPSFSKYCRLLCDRLDFRLPPHMEEATRAKSSWEHFDASARYMDSGSRFFTMSGGYYGLGPTMLMPNDVCAVFFGSRTPYVLRPDMNGEYRFVGHCYVHGFMDGEAMDMLEMGVLQQREFVIR